MWSMAKMRNPNEDEVEALLTGIGIVLIILTVLVLAL